MNKFIPIIIAIATWLAPAAWASGIDYTFNQTGYSDSSGNTGALTGSFVATSEPDGTTRITDFIATFDWFNTGGAGSGREETFTFTHVNDFSWSPSNPGTLGFSSGSFSSGEVLCTDNADVNSVCGQGLAAGSVPGSPANGFFEDLPNIGPLLTLQPNIVTAVAAPEPGTLMLFACGLGLCLAGLLFRRRIQEKLNSFRVSRQGESVGNSLEYVCGSVAKRSYIAS